MRIDTGSKYQFYSEKFRFLKLDSNGVNEPRIIITFGGKKNTLMRPRYISVFVVFLCVHLSQGSSYAVYTALFT